MLKKRVILGLFAVVFLVAGCGVKPPKKGPEKFEEKLVQIIDRLSDSLNLSEEQKQKTALIRDEILKKNKESRDLGKGDAKKAEEAVMKQLKGEKLDEAELIKIIGASDKKKEEMRNFMIHELVKFHAVLTPVQRTKLAEILQKVWPGPGPKPEKKPEDNDRK